MKNQICFLAIIWANLGFWSCQDQNPISPELLGSKEKAAVKNTSMRVDYMVDYSQVQIVDPGKRFVDENGVLHIRDQVFSGAPITGDLVGKNKRTLINADIDIASGNGKVFGTYAHEVIWAKRNFNGVLEGRYEVEIVAGAISGIRIVPSSDSLMGLKIASTQEQMLPGSMKLKLNSVMVDSNNMEK